MVYGYARVSAQDQNLDTQIEQLMRYGVDEIVKENKWSNKTKARVRHYTVKTNYWGYFGRN